MQIVSVRVSRYLHRLPVHKPLPAEQLPRHAIICQVFNLVAAVHLRIKRIRHNTSYRSCYKFLYMVKGIKAKPRLNAFAQIPNPFTKGAKAGK